MENNADIILTDFETGITTLSNNSDLNNIFNFTYNFDLLKEVLSTVIKNQVNLKNQLDERYKVQNQIMESLKGEIIEIKQAQGQFETKDSFKITQEDYDKLNERINNFEIKISQINDELDKSKL
jgi:predicted flavoprotein YhiN